MKQLLEVLRLVFGGAQQHRAPVVACTLQMRGRGISCSRGTSAADGLHNGHSERCVAGGPKQLPPLKNAMIMMRATQPSTHSRNNRQIKINMPLLLLLTPPPPPPPPLLLLLLLLLLLASCCLLHPPNPTPPRPPRPHLRLLFP